MNAPEHAVRAPEHILDEIEATVDRAGGRLVELSHAIHAHPELGGHEHDARARVLAELTNAGFVPDARQPAAETAFSARFGNGELLAVVCVEYDALPGIGHACGHNVNAAAAVGAGLGLASVAEALGITVHMLGTPAEETIGGKVELIEEGFFDEAHLAIMAHAAGEDLVGNRSLAMTLWEFTYRGRAAHAAAAPEEGVNALDAAVIAQTAIALARQQLPSGAVVSVVLDEAGGAVNVIPDLVRGRVEMRGLSSDSLLRIMQRVRKCLEAGALATDCGLSVEETGHSYAELHQDPALCLSYRDALARRGRDVPITGTAVASTDMGNVSLIVPSLHPMIGYDVGGAVHHTAQFASFGCTPSADLAVIDAAYGLAAAVAALAGDGVERARLLERTGAAGR